MAQNSWGLWEQGKCILHVEGMRMTEGHITDRLQQMLYGDPSEPNDPDLLSPYSV